MRTLATFLLMITVCISSLKAVDKYNIDFESEETSPKALSISGWLYDNSLEIIENPLPIGLNKSNNVLAFEAQEGIEWWGGAFIETQEITTTQELRYLYLKVLAEDNFNTKFMVGLFSGTIDNYTDLSINLHPTRTASLDTEWRELCFVLEPGMTFNTIRIQPGHFGYFYIDDIRLSDEAPLIPNIKQFSIDFETEENVGVWSKNSEEGACYKAPVAESPFVNDINGNISESCMRMWITQGTWDKYGGGRLESVYGKTTESTRYLHARYFFNSNEEAHNSDKSLRIFVDNTDNYFESEPLSYNQWNDVTIDLGVGTLIKYLVFNIDGWWVTLGIDDIQLDGNPDERDDIIIETGINNNNNTENYLCYAVEDGIRIDNLKEDVKINIYPISGILIESKIINSSQKITLNKGTYIISLSNKISSNCIKLIVK